MHRSTGRGSTCGILPHLEKFSILQGPIHVGKPRFPFFRVPSTKANHGSQTRPWVVLLVVVSFLEIQFFFINSRLHSTTHYAARHHSTIRKRPSYIPLTLSKFLILKPLSTSLVYNSWIKLWAVNWAHDLPLNFFSSTFPVLSNLLTCGSLQYLLLRNIHSSMY